MKIASEPDSNAGVEVSAASCCPCTVLCFTQALESQTQRSDRWKTSDGGSRSVLDQERQQRSLAEISGEHSGCTRVIDVYGDASL